MLELTGEKNITINSFELLKVIGRGGFSRVVLARKKDTGMLYAIKILSKQHVDQKRNRVKLERDIMLQLNHDNVIKLYWTFQTSKELFFVMELCTGGELFYHLQIKETFSEHETKYYINQVVTAISHLHERGIVYRDLKPENLLVDEHGNLKLADFGLSK